MKAVESAPELANSFDKQFLMKLLNDIYFCGFNDIFYSQNFNDVSLFKLSPRLSRWKNFSEQTSLQARARILTENETETQTNYDRL